MKEIIIYGRGGQGAVTAAQLLATAAFLEGYRAQTFPQFGAERRGAPVIAYIRIDKEPIAIRSKVYSPDVVVVMDFNLFKMIKPLDNLKAGGTAIINFPAADRQLPDQIKKKADHIYTIDASAIAHKIYGKTAIPITNIIHMGAYCAAMKDVSNESIITALPDFFAKNKLEINRKAAQMGYENIKGAS